MIQKAILILLLIPGVCFGEKITKEDISGEWEFLGGSSEITKDYSTLMIFTPSEIVYSPDGSYKYLREGKNTISGEWSYQNSLIIVKRKDGVFNNKIHSFENGLLITYEELFGQKRYMYLKKK